jgi:hypothetical protein
MIGTVRLSNYAPLFSLILGLVSSCGSDDEPEPFEALDPTQPQYGKTFDEWAAEWVYYVWSYAPPLCDDPVKHPTGATCADRQDPTSPVFFLAGTYGGPAVRKECVVPADKALFFPLGNYWGDNGGMPADMLLSDDAIRENIESGALLFIKERFYATVDGRPVADVTAGIMTKAAPYRIHVPEGPNSYTCDIAAEVSGDFDGYVMGAWVMLPPLGPGKHVIEFGSAREAEGLEPAFQTDTRYELTVAPPER